jgi:protein-tyrosine phosphatase
MLIDCHCHLLPGIDDGSHSHEMTLEMARAAVAAGVDAVVCTPHHCNGVYSNPAPRIRDAVAETAERLAEAGLPLRLYSGSELHLVPELPGRLLDGSAMTYNDCGRAALVELPKRTVPLGTPTLLEQLIYQGIRPVIAHPERNAELAVHPERLGEWVGMGCAAQLTAQSCSGALGQRLQSLCRYWLDQGWVHLIASDAHRPSGRSPDTLTIGRETIATWLGREAATVLTVTNPQRLLSGDALVDLPPQTRQERPSRFSGWLHSLVQRRRV